jgi:2-haloacid dehalogenase
MPTTDEGQGRGSAARPQNVVFDVGNVLIDWDPRYLYRKIFAGDEDRVRWFLDHVCTMEWNQEQDRGRSWSDGVAALAARKPQWRAEIEAYDRRWNEMVSGPIEGSVTLLQRLRGAGIPTYAITNFSVEKFTETRRRFAFLDGFTGIVASGEVGLLKPDPAIFRLFLDRFGLAPGTCVFVDDNPANIASARDLGFCAHRFTEPGRFAAALRDLGLPV